MRKLTTEQFVQRGRLIHGDRYDYSMTVYEISSTPVKIICKKHGLFTQKPRDHLQGCGCPRCKVEKNALTRIEKSKNKFIEQAQQVHGCLYDYTKVNYVGAQKKVNIGCKKHGWFKVTPNKHLGGLGCAKCGYERLGDIKRYDTETFIKKAKEVHQNGIVMYDYSEVEYLGCIARITIICPKHGKFIQTAKDHLQGCGCPTCGHETSRGESKVERYLIDNSVKFIKQKTFKGLVGLKQRKLRFDFYLPDYNVAIEFDGEQHFKPVNFRGKFRKKSERIKRFLDVQRCDKIKNDYARSNGIGLIRIPYTEIDNIDRIITEELQRLHCGGT